MENLSIYVSQNEKLILVSPNSKSCKSSFIERFLKDYGEKLSALEINYNDYNISYRRIEQLAGKNGYLHIKESVSYQFSYKNLYPVLPMTVGRK